MVDKKGLGKAWWFLIGVSAVYVLMLLINLDAFVSSLKLFVSIAVRVIPVFLLVFVLMVLSDYFVSPKFAIKHLGGRGIRKWFFVVAGGILSSGPIYMWYPLLADLKSRGLSFGLIACFLYNRAIKIPLLPLAIAYFGWEYVLILSIVMVLASLAQGFLINRLMGVAGQ